MITIDLADAAEVPSGSAKQFIVDGLKLCVVRIDDDVYVISDTCSHADISLAEGEVNCDDREIECWKHGSAFSLQTGEPQTLPATQPVPVYQARLVNGRIEVMLP